MEYLVGAPGDAMKMVAKPDSMSFIEFMPAHTMLASMIPDEVKMEIEEFELRNPGSGYYLAQKDDLEALKGAVGVVMFGSVKSIVSQNSGKARYDPRKKTVKEVIEEAVRKRGELDGEK